MKIVQRQRPSTGTDCASRPRWTERTTCSPSFNPEKRSSIGSRLSWEDVVNLPPRSTTRIAWVPDDRPGSWMYHCHILEHHEAGMMGHFEVVRDGAATRQSAHRHVHNHEHHH